MLRILHLITRLRRELPPGGSLSINPSRKTNFMERFVVVGPKTLAGAIALSAYKRKKFSGVCTASTLLPSAEHEKRNRIEGGSCRGYAIKMR